MVENYGYAGKILKVDLSNGNISTVPTANYSKRFIGGRGIAAKIYWEMVHPQTKAYDPENCLIAMTGPITGFKGIAGSGRWQVCGTSPLIEPEVFSYANLGERWGTWLKYAGYDGLVIQGQAEKPSYIYINEDSVEIRDAFFLWGKSSFEVSEIIKTELGNKVSVLTIGPAAENLVPFATLTTDDGSSGASGLGSVMGSKKLKAVVVAANKYPITAAYPERVAKLTKHIHQLRAGAWKGWLEDVPGRTKLRPCYSCSTGCFRKTYLEDGRRFKFFCQAEHVYWVPAHEYQQERGAEVALLAIRLCDRYGLDTTVMGPMIGWLLHCYQEGVLGEEETGLPLSKVGSAEFIKVLTRKIAFREGFGDLLARGTIKASEMIGKKAHELSTDWIATRGSELRDYDPRLIPVNSLLYATEQRRPISQLHEASHSLLLWLRWLQNDEGAFLSYEDLVRIAESFWGGADAADYSTNKGKALAAKKIQDRAYAKESLLLCDFLWPVLWVRYGNDHTGDPTLESQLFSAITGFEIDEAGLNKIGERIFNLQRAIMLRQGWGGRKGDRLLDHFHEKPLESALFNPDCLVPGPQGHPVSRKGAKVDREAFEKLKSEYYTLRGWDVDSGLPVASTLEKLELNDITSDLETKNLLR